MYKIGQKVKIIKDITAHGFEIGEIGEIMVIAKGHYKVNNNKNEGFVFATEIQPINRTIRDVEIGDKFIIGNCAEHKVIDVGKNGLVDEEHEYTSFGFAERFNWKIKQERTDNEIIKECIKYCQHRLKCHPEAGLRKFTNLKRLDQIIQEIK